MLKLIGRRAKRAPKITDYVGT
ncbi:hypothetical protein NVIE_1952 [Nitrososphaera viennensis EN76]|uniref:Uncharacterized protein n=1 Tax=Nitrososphaera viennensis EN76 TaxID=926571 RepID=A0A060HKZ3_9ARCH|nr:hypothetical protein NVIE_1952 [Nitrososphaera viennensis EN76]